MRILGAEFGGRERRATSFTSYFSSRAVATRMDGCCCVGLLVILVVFC